MKTLISLIVMILILSSVSFAQKVTPDKVPAVVKQAFSKEYPKAIETSWRMYDNNYQALFNLNGVKHAAKFDKNGQWIDKEERIDLSNLPKEVTASIAKNFAGYKA
ncbi:MAG: PepSY-like domain-containing protein, partial [Bacteroidales bacterium]